MRDFVCTIVCLQRQGHPQPQRAHATRCYTCTQQAAYFHARTTAAAIRSNARATIVCLRIRMRVRVPVCGASRPSRNYRVVTVSRRRRHCDNVAVHRTAKPFRNNSFALMRCVRRVW